LFRNAFTYKGKKIEVRSWSVKIQRFGKRKSFTLSSPNRAQAAGEACQIYQTISEQGWEALTHGPGGNGRRMAASASLLSPASIAVDAEYWKRRLIHRTYPEPARGRDREFSVRIEYARRSQYFPLGTSDEAEAAARAMRIYRAVVDKGWGFADGLFPRELSLALRWQDNPLAWTYTTIHTRRSGGPGSNRGHQGHRVALIEPDVGIRFALAECANSQEGFRCDLAFDGMASALRELPRQRVDLVLANHDLPEAPPAFSLDALQRVRPGLAVICYSVFEDADQLFKSTPGGSAVYMLSRTSPYRLFEPIADLEGPPARERVASCVRAYFQRLSALLPLGTPIWKLARLTPREHEILDCLSKGDLVKEIADRLGISNWTVQGHVKSIFEKLNVHTRTEAVIKYLHK
jgi:DNA-binding NarL/FixJ family response regulator